MIKNILQKIKKNRFKNFNYYAMRGVYNKTLRDLVIRVMVSERKKTNIVKEKSIFIKSDNLETHVQNLNNNGFSLFDYNLSTQCVENILLYIEQLNCYDPYRKYLGHIDHNNAPEETHIAHYVRTDLSKSEDILKIANDSGILSIVQEFLGATPTISNINMWWSFGGRKQAEEAQLFHRDVDDWKFCKVFIYLTNVDFDNGPHVYVKGSSISAKHRKRGRYNDKEIENTFGKENITTFVKPAGSAFIVDTYGFHKGLLPISGKRLLLQIQYSLNPLDVEIYNPVKLEKFNDGYDTYINRLIISK